MNIGFFPLSGIRVCDEELLRLGLTLPGFVERSKTIASLPSLGLLTLAGMTPKHHNKHYVEVPDGRLLDPLPKNIDLAVISTYSAQADEAYALAQRFKAIGVRTIIGGPHVSALPEEAAQYCDCVVIGEGEPVWPQVLEDAENLRLKQYYKSDDREFSLDNAPMPAFELLDISKYNRLTVQTSRGCPHQCEFCASSVMLTNQYKQKSVSTVNGCFIIGLDGHTKDIFEQIFTFVKESELYEVQITIMTPFPGTPLYARLERENRLLEPKNWKKCTLFDINYSPANLSVEELHNGFKKLAVEMYSDEFTKWRRRKFKQSIRKSAAQKARKE